MAPQTRAQEKAQAASETYSHAPPAPKQQTFPGRRKIIRKYGKKHRKSAPPGLLKQQTLTQIVEPGDTDLELFSVTHDSIIEGPKKRRKTMGDSPNFGFESRNSRSSANPLPSSSFHTQTLAQFLRDKSLKIEDTEDEDRLNLITRNSEKNPSQDGDIIQRTPSSKITMTEIPASTQSVFSTMLDRYSPPGQQSSPSQLKAERRSTSFYSETNLRMTQTTPPMKNIKVEIPPSNESPGTPVPDSDSDSDCNDYNEIGPESPLAGKSTSSGRRGRESQGQTPQTPTQVRFISQFPPNGSISSLMMDRYSPAGPRRSPLKEKSTNTMLLQMDENSADTQGDIFECCKQSPSLKSALKKTPIKKTPAKHTRFILPRDPSEEKGQNSKLVLGNNDDDFALESFSSPNTRVQRRNPQAKVIPDSDEEVDWLDSEKETESDESPRSNKPDTRKDRMAISTDEQFENNRKIETHKWTTQNYGDIGDETQAMVDKVISSVEQKSVPSTVAESLSRQSTGLSSSPSISHTESKKTSSSGIQTFQPIPRPTRRLKARPAQGTQWESQRLPIELVRKMVPHNSHSADIFVSVDPPEVDCIVNSTQNHIFRDYQFPKSITRLWIYATQPVKELRYMAHIGSVKQQGEIKSKRGLRNAEFNAGWGPKHAYEIFQVYELNNPVSLNEMREEGWINTPPQQYKLVPPAVLGQLVANLRCELFDDEGPDEEFMAGSQLIDSQIHSNTQVALHEKIELEMAGEEVIPSSQKDEIAMAPPKTQMAPRGKLNTVQTPRQSRMKRAIQFPQARKTAASRDDAVEDEVIEETPRSTRYHTVNLSQATTASQPSIPTQSPTQSSVWMETLSSLPVSEDIEQSPIRLQPGRFSYSPSDLLTRSQMLPESLQLDMNLETRDSEQNGLDLE